MPIKLILTLLKAAFQIKSTDAAFLGLIFRNFSNLDLRLQVWLHQKLGASTLKFIWEKLEVVHQHFSEESNI